MRLIDADLFDKELNEYSDAHWEGEFYACEDIRSMLEDAPTINPYEWISVKDRLPENDVPVLVYKDKYNDAYANMETAYFDCGRWMGVIGEHVTHWMPLPTPPTEKEN